MDLLFIYLIHPILCAFWFLPPSSPRVVFFFSAANWLQLSVASAAGGSRPLAGGTFVRGRGAAPDFATHLMLRHPLALTMVRKIAYRRRPVFLHVHVFSRLFIGHDPNSRVESGTFQNLTGRVGSGQEVFNFSRIASGHRHPTRPDLT